MNERRRERGPASEARMKKIADGRGRQRPESAMEIFTELPSSRPSPSPTHALSARGVEGSRDFVHPLLQPCSLFNGVCRLFFHYNEPFAKRRRWDAAMQGATSIMANGHSAWSEFRGRWSIKRGEKEETTIKAGAGVESEGESKGSFFIRCARIFSGGHNKTQVRATRPGSAPFSFCVNENGRLELEALSLVGLSMLV